MTSLDIGYKQVLVHFPGDPFPWHHRVLLERGEAGKWVCCTPDYDVQLIDLTTWAAGGVVP